LLREPKEDALLVLAKAFDWDRQSLFFAGRGVIHKDIKPANILVNSFTGQCWLTGFGISSRLPRERQSAEPQSLWPGH
jgi:serine/threonine protein kinase